MDYSFECIVEHSHQTKNYILKGKIDVDTLIENLSKAFTETVNSYHYNILVDIREAELPDFLSKLNDYIGFLQEASKVINMKRKCAIVTSKPQDVVIAELLQQELTRSKFDLRIGIFSTMEVALKWIH